MYDERKKEILKLLSTRGYMTVEELAQHLYISEPTVPRDRRRERCDDPRAAGNVSEESDAGERGQYGPVA